MKQTVLQNGLINEAKQVEQPTRENACFKIFNDTFEWFISVSIVIGNVAFHQ